MESQRTLFQTTRLRVRLMEARDLEALLEVYGDREAMRWVDDGEPLSRAQALRWIEVTARNIANRGYGMSPVELRDGGTVIGFCGLVHPGGQDEAELKYAYRREVWGNGIASEVARGMCGYGERVHGLREVIATVAPANIASQRVLANAGFALREERSREGGARTLVFHRDLSA